jgi:hypothetical protein
MFKAPSLSQRKCIFYVHFYPITGENVCIADIISAVTVKSKIKWSKVYLSRYRRAGAKAERRVTSALDGGEWSASRPGRTLPPGKGTPVPIVQEAGWATEMFWTQRLEEKSFRLCRGLNLNRPVVQPVARHYTDWATRLTRLPCKNNNISQTQNITNIILACVIEDGCNSPCEISDSHGEKYEDSFLI